MYNYNCTCAITTCRDIGFGAKDGNHQRNLEKGPEVFLQMLRTIVVEVGTKEGKIR